MYKIDQDKPSRAWVSAWQAAGRHIEHIGQGGVQWLRSNLYTPMVEHLSFRLGNQLFFVFVDAGHEGEGSYLFSAFKRDVFLKYSEQAGAVPCLMKMKRSGDDWQTVHNSWGFISAMDGSPIYPPALVSYELIEITDWELQDFAVQVVPQQLTGQDIDIDTHQSSLDIDPSIWFLDNGEITWVVVRATRYPAEVAAIPENLGEILHQCEPVSSRGYFASVSAGCADEALGPDAPLYRGYPYYAKYSGLKALDGLL